MRLVYKSDDIRFKDVADEMVRLFDPTEETLSIVEDIRGIFEIFEPLMPIE